LASQSGRQADNSVVSTRVVSEFDAQARPHRRAGAGRASAT